VAEHEREMISARTKAALAAAKARGVQLGTPANLTNRIKGTARSAVVRQERTQRRAADLRPMIEAIQASRAISLRAIAAELNRRGAGEWQAAQIKRVLDRG
jgi:DNA invertase Pin-like site-specific DNA recombinase